jgi:hypothetical protein
MTPELMLYIRMFFLEPEIEANVRPGFIRPLSVLYMLRRDIKSCLESSRYLFPATMALLAGIDLLGKFYAGDDSRGGVTRRFEGFVSAYFQPLSPGDAAVIYALRNALLHSFGLYSEGRNFMLAERHSSGELVVTAPDGTLIIGADTLYMRFEQAIAQYLAALQTDVVLQQNFERMVDRYGFVHMGIAPTPPPNPSES